MLQVLEFRLKVSLAGVIANKLNRLLGILSWQLLLIVFNEVFEAETGFVVFAFSDFLVDYGLDGDPGGYFCAVGGWDLELVLNWRAYWEGHKVGCRTS